MSRFIVAAVSRREQACVRMLMRFVDELWLGPSCHRCQRCQSRLLSLAGVHEAAQRRPAAQVYRIVGVGLLF